MLLETNVNNAYDSFMSTINQCYDKHFPKVRIRIDQKSENKPWLTKGLINACHKKNNLYKAFILNRSEENESRYKRYENKLTSMLRYCEKRYYSDLLLHYKSNIKATWNVLNSLIKTKSCVNIPEKFFYSENNKLAGVQNIVNEFNKYFVNVGPNLAQSIPEENEQNVLNYMSDANANCFYINPVDESEILNVTNGLKNKTSKDFNDILMQMVKNIIALVSKPFCHICNLSFSSGIFPENMKIAKVLPLFKGENNSVFNNYRPVSLLPQFSKILEKLLDERLQKFLNKYEILNESQDGFRQGRSTGTALMELIEEICSSRVKKSTQWVSLLI